jgi:hypothetical protein
MSFTIKVGYDQDSEAYFVKSSDVPGLSVASDRAVRVQRGFRCLVSTWRRMLIAPLLKY